MKAVYIFVALTAIFAVVAIIANAKKMISLKLIAKTTASVFFVLIAISSFNITVFASWQALILAGLVCGLIGDIFVTVVATNPADQKLFDAFGVVAFMAGHLFYILAFAELTKSFNYLLLILIAACPILIITLELTQVITMKNLPMKIGAVVYAIVIGTMLAFAVNVYLGLGNKEFTLYILIGAILFTISDIAIAVREFNSKLKGNQILHLMLGVYYVAQILFALSIGIL
ncbi:MAG TPA: lysoplasmalogenase [Clostridia bacterium]|nr:lysoplasmalogenase [Clostridia bacterium]